jgi:hypothetical protein
LGIGDLVLGIGDLGIWDWAILKRKYLNEFLLSIIPYYELKSFIYNDKSHSEETINFHIMKFQIIIVIQ